MSLDPGLIRLSYELWEASLPGREYILSVEDLPEALDKLPRSEAVDVNRALRSLNRLGHLVAEGGLDARFVTSLVGREVIRTVVKVMPLIQEARERRADPAYLEYIDRLLSTCQEAYPSYEPQYSAVERRGISLQV